MRLVGVLLLCSLPIASMGQEPQRCDELRAQAAAYAAALLQSLRDSPNVDAERLAAARKRLDEYLTALKDAGCSMP